MNPVAALFLSVTQAAGGPGQGTVAAAVARARPGDTVRVPAGVHAEHVVIDRPLVLLGEPGAVLDGSREGVVLTITAPNVVVRGLTIRHSGRSQAREDAGLLAERAEGLVVEDNTFEEVLFGAYLKETPHAVIRHNLIVGKDFPVALRGDGIRLWSSPAGRIEGNDVRRVRDVVIWFSDSAVARGNRVRDSRYGLHYMYSNHGVFDDNRFDGNHVGAFIMYSDDLTFRRNVFGGARGTTGRGIGFKDADRIKADDNVFVGNAVGISIDNSPRSERVRNVFRHNLIAYNDVGIVLLPSVRANDFLGNTFRDNLAPVRVTGGGRALANTWAGNAWSDYAGFDADGDGTGDAPFTLTRVSDDLVARHEALAIFATSPGLTALDLLGRVLPLLEPEPVVIDSVPRLTGATAPSEAPRPGATAAALLGALGLGAIGVGLRGRHPHRTVV